MTTIWRIKTKLLMIENAGGTITKKNVVTLMN